MEKAIAFLRGFLLVNHVFTPRVGVQLDIRLSKNGWIMFCELIERDILIGNAMEWLEEFIMMGITHETIHLVLQEMESLDTSEKFDNIFGYADPSILLVPTEETEFDSVQRDRLERNFWNEKSRNRRRKLGRNS